jgi:hypothetical protein
MGLLVIVMAPYDSRFMGHKPPNSDNTAVFRLMWFVLSSQILASDCRRTWITNEQNWAREISLFMANNCVYTEHRHLYILVILRPVSFVVTVMPSPD